MATLTLEEFESRQKLPDGMMVVRCGCGHESCEGWAQIFSDLPWGLREHEAPINVSGPLPMSSEFSGAA